MAVFCRGGGGVAAQSLMKDQGACFEAFEAGAGRMKILREGRRYISVTELYGILDFLEN